jgi:hypothetical protein
MACSRCSSHGSKWLKMAQTLHRHVQAYSLSAQVKAAVAHLRRLKQNSERKINPESWGIIPGCPANRNRWLIGLHASWAFYCIATLVYFTDHLLSWVMRQTRHSTTQNKSLTASAPPAGFYAFLRGGGG